MNENQRAALISNTRTHLQRSRQEKCIGMNYRNPFGSALMEVVLLLSAERDLQEAYSWVEEHRRGREQFSSQTQKD
jgi:hypothetical protein